MQNDMTNDREKIAARLKEARTLSGLSQAQAADKMNIPRPAISEIESGKRKVSAEEIIQFAALYKVDKAWLLLEEGNKDEFPQQLKFAARELGKLNTDEVQKLLDILKKIPK